MGITRDARSASALYGGTLDAGPKPEGGFAVRASLPLHVGLPVTIRVVVADDQATVREGSRLVLEVDPGRHGGR